MRKLTRLEPDTTDGDPVISPDGKSFVFFRGSPDTSGIVVIDRRGRERMLDLGCVAPCDVDVVPSWTADGRRIVFTRVVGPYYQVNDSARSAVLYSAKPDGTDVQRVSPPGIDGAFEDYHARYSADGSYLVFVRVRNEDISNAVFRMNTDGTDVRQLTPWELDADLPDLSLATRGPTEDLVVFETYGQGAPEGESPNIATVPSTCEPVAACATQIRYITTNGAGPRQSFNPAWSPDGKRIAYVEFDPGDETTPPQGDIWTIRHNATQRHRLSTSPRIDYRPDWGIG